MHKQDIHSGDLTNLSWEQLKGKLDSLREKRKQNMIIKVLSKLLSDADNPYCEEENRIRMAMFEKSFGCEEENRIRMAMFERHVTTENNEKE